jgi:hypothetical protein
VIYQIEVLGTSGTAIKTLTEFHELKWARRENTIGVLELKMPAKNIDPTFFAVDQQFEVFRNGGILNETSYFLRYFELYEDGNRNRFARFICYDANYLLDSRIVANYAGSSEAEKTLEADDMMKAIVDEQLVSHATTARNLSNLTVAADTTSASSISKAFSRQNVYKLLQDIADTARNAGEYLCFDVVRTSRNEFQFRTYFGQRGNDHTFGSGDPRYIGPSYGNLSEPSVIMFDRRNERNYAYAGGQGEGADRVIETSENTTRTGASPYNRREVWVDSRHSDDTDIIQGRADEAVEKGRPIRMLTGKLTETAGMRFGIDYGFGDLVTAEAFGFSVDCHLDYIQGIYRASGSPIEVINTNLRGEL